jgi:hypothetical protein
VADTVASATYMSADVDWYIKADDIIEWETANKSATSKQEQ